MRKDPPDPAHSTGARAPVKVPSIPSKPKEGIFMHATLISQESIENKIFFLRGKKVMLSPHLAVLYSVETKVLLQSVRRNHDRFPEDFMFQLT